MKSTTEPTYILVISYYKYKCYALSFSSLQENLNFLDQCFRIILRSGNFRPTFPKKKRKFSILKKQRSSPEYFALTRPSRREEKGLEGMKERRQVAAQVFGTFQLVAGLFLAMPLMQLCDIVDDYCTLYE